MFKDLRDAQDRLPPIEGVKSGLLGGASLLPGYGRAPPVHGTPCGGGFAFRATWKMGDIHELRCKLR